MLSYLLVKSELDRFLSGCQKVSGIDEYVKSGHRLSVILLKAEHL